MVALSCLRGYALPNCGENVCGLFQSRFAQERGFLHARNLGGFLYHVGAVFQVLNGVFPEEENINLDARTMP